MSIWPSPAFSLHFQILIALFSLIPSAHSQGYAAYSGFGGDQATAGDDPKSVALGSNIRKAPVAPIAPPRVPLFPMDDEPIINTSQNGPSTISAQNSVSYRPAPPPVRREARSEGKCRYDGTKWQIHPQSAAANAVMFDRTSGLSCEQCLESCTKYQDHSTEWICRSVTYDHRWKICDLFAVNGTESPYFLLEYEGRDYFEYMAALPPTDLEMFGISRKEQRDSNYDKNAISPVSPAPSPNSIKEEALDGNKQCICPCKALAQLTAPKSAPLDLEANELDDSKLAPNASSPESNIASGQNEALPQSAENTPKHLAGVKPLPSASSSEGPIMESSPSPLPIIGGQSTSDEMANSESAATQQPNRVFPSLPPFEHQNEQKTQNSSASSDLDLLSSPPSSSSSLFSSPSSPSFSLSPNSFSPTSPPPISSELTSFSAQSPAPLLASSNSSSSHSSQSFSSSSFSSESISITNSSFKEDISNSAHSSNIRKAFASKTFQPHKEIRVPFRKSLDKVARVGMRLFTDNGNSGEKRMPFSAEITQQRSIRASACPRQGQIAHYVQIRGRMGKRKGRVELAKGTKTQSECLDACDSPSGHLSLCNSAQFSTKGCELSASTANFSSADSLAVVPKNNSAQYLEKICLDSAIAKSEKRRLFPAIPGFILVGHVQEVSNAGSLAECLKSCLLAEIDFGFVCKSLMYYPADQDQNCLMNSESRHTQKDVFVPEDQQVNMLYLDIDPQKVPLALPTSGDEQRRFKDSPMKMEEKAANGTWTRWSKCLNEKEMRHRYLKCKEAKDVRRCPKESIPCKRMPSLKIQRIWRPETDARGFSECLAVRDARGMKRCPYGMRWNGQQREFCTPPVDC